MNGKTSDRSAFRRVYPALVVTLMDRGDALEARRWDREPELNIRLEVSWREPPLLPTKLVDIRIGAAMAERERRPSVAEALERHVTLDIECFDRMVFNAYVPLLQSGGGVVTFLREHRGNPIPSPALFAPIGETFRASGGFAEEHGVPLLPFRSRRDKLAAVRPYLDAAAAADREGVVAIGLAQERRSVWMGSLDHCSAAAPHYGFRRVERRITVFYSNLFDREWGPASIQICSYAPYSAQLSCNGHERAKRQLEERGIAFARLRAMSA